MVYLVRGLESPREHVVHCWEFQVRQMNTIIACQFSQLLAMRVNVGTDSVTYSVLAQPKHLCSSNSVPSSWKSMTILIGKFCNNRIDSSGVCVFSCWYRCVICCPVFDKRSNGSTESSAGKAVHKRSGLYGDSMLSWWRYTVHGFTSKAWYLAPWPWSGELFCCWYCCVICCLRSRQAF